MKTLGLNSFWVSMTQLGRRPSEGSNSCDLSIHATGTIFNHPCGCLAAVPPCAIRQEWLDAGFYTSTSVRNMNKDKYEGLAISSPLLAGTILRPTYKQRFHGLENTRHEKGPLDASSLSFFVF